MFQKWDMIMAVDHTLICKMCDSFFTEPKDLPCKHTFCEACLKAHCLSTATVDTFPCPVCSKPVKVKDANVPLLEWPTSIPTNKVTAGRLEKMHVIEKERRQTKCLLCAQKWLSTRATKYCKSCEEYFCEECGTQHWLLRSSKEHRVYLLDELLELKRDPYLRAELILMFNARVRESKIHKRSEGLFSSSIENIHDENDCDLSGATFLDNGQIAIVDKGNECIKLFDKHFGFVTRMELRCHDLLQLNKYFIVASCPNEKCLKYVSIYKNKFEIDQSVELDFECFGLTHVEENTSNFAVATGGRPMKLLVYEGSKLRDTTSVSNGKLLLLRPDYLTYDPSRTLYFVSDSMNKCLKCVKASGELEWERKIPECRGIAMFHDYLLVARSDRKTVDIINKSAQIVKSVVTVDEELSRVSVLCRDHLTISENSTRLLVMDDTDLARVFLVEDPLMDSDLKTYLRKNTEGSDQGSSSSLNDNKEGNSSMCHIL